MGRRGSVGRLTVVGIFLFVFAVPATVAQTWNAAGSGDWFAAGNWNPAIIPSAGDSPMIQNGGHALAGSATATGPINLVLVDVGTDGGMGNLTVDAVDLLLQSSLDVGDVASTVATGIGTTINSDGTATFLDSNSVEVGIGGVGDVNSGQTSASDGAVAMGTGHVTLERITNVQVAGDIDVAQSSGTGQATGNGTVAIRDVSSLLDIGGDIDIGQTSAGIGGINSGTGMIVIERVGTLEIGGDFDVGQTTGAGHATGSGTVITSDVTTLNIGGSFDVGKVRALGTAGNNAVANVTIVGSDVTVGLGAANPGSIEIARVLASETALGQATASLTFQNSDVMVANDVIVGELGLGSQQAANFADATLTLIDSRIDTRDLSVAVRFDNTNGTVAGKVELTRSLAIVQGTLLLSSDAIVTLNIDGLTRAIGDGLDTDYSAIDADMATIAGSLEVAATGDYLGPAARGDVETFELINTLFGITGQFDSVTYDGESVGTSPTYVRTTGTGTDGLFANVSQTADQLALTSYLALGGDANGDQTVDGSDFLIWNSNKFTTGTDWSSGDFNGDGITDGSDFLIWNGNKFTSVDQTTVVPESTSVMWVAVFGALAMRFSFGWTTSFPRIGKS